MPLSYQVATPGRSPLSNAMKALRAGDSRKSAMLKVVTLNLNGIRSAARKGFFEWLAAQRADFICLQELKCQLGDLTEAMRACPNYHGYFHCAAKRGYSGVAIYTRHAPRKLIEGIGIPDIDAEGRYLRLEYDALQVVSIYVPSGSSSEARQTVKFSFMERVLPHLKELKNCGREVILCGDINIAHTKQDLKNWRSNQKNSGFLPEERIWLSKVFDEAGWVDVFRVLNQQSDQYTWWSNRGQAWAKNVGWRIDYQLATPGIAKLARAAAIFKAQRFSDHAPLTIDYKFEV
jgi:exodeoxyribonuclease-3